LLNFSRKDRLISKQDFQFVFDQPSKSTRHALLALCRPNQQSIARLGIMIGKRYVRRAVDRNRLRRVIRERFRQQKEDLQGLDIVVMLRSATPSYLTKTGKQTLRDDIDTLWQAITSKK
jgi:ribonuclease P protein component